MAYDPNQPRDEKGRWTSYRQNTPYNEIVKNEEEPQSASVENESLKHNDERSSDLPTIKLPRNEYAMVMSEIATNLTEDERKSPIIIRSIRNYTYKVENLGFGNYRVIGKWKIRSKLRKRRRKKLGIHR